MADFWMSPAKKNVTEKQETDIHVQANTCIRQQKGITVDIISVCMNVENSCFNVCSYECVCVCVCV